jgi:hypothetical protein
MASVADNGDRGFKGRDLQFYRIGRGDGLPSGTVETVNRIENGSCRRETTYSEPKSV